MDGYDVDALMGGAAGDGGRLGPGVKNIDTRSPEELADEGITITVDEHGKRHIRMKADPVVWLPDGPKTVACGFDGCEAEITFTESGPTHGWIPPHPGRTSWTCPACRGDLKPLRVTRERVV